SLLAVMMLMMEYKDCKANIIACVSNEKYLLPSAKMREKNIIMLKTDDMMAQMIAHTSTEPGLSVAFKELLNFEGNEFYFEKDERFIDKTVLDLARMIDHATLVGIKHNGKVTLNPEREMVVKEGDDVILFETGKDAYKINDIGEKRVEKRELDSLGKEVKGKLFIIGTNVLLDTILSELPNDVKDITIVSKAKYLEEKYKDIKALKVADIDYENDLERIASQARHIVILSDRSIDKEDSDIKNILLVLKLMDLKERKNYVFNITAELNMENSYRIAVKNNQIDYVVSSNVASLVLAQISEDPKLEPVFKELLSKKGNELFSKTLSSFNLSTKHDYSYGGLKQIILSYGYTLLGYSKQEEMFLNVPLEERIQFEKSDRLIVLGKE
ncbi:MAG: hypothetical protein IJ875_07295, partial [Solobacterium sp.]|nr:hypothetical protein [Solobacterium sp.]